MKTREDNPMESQREKVTQEIMQMVRRADMHMLLLISTVIKSMME